VATTEQKAPAIAIDTRRRPRLHLVYSGDEVLLPPRVFGPLRGATPIGREIVEGIGLPRDRKASRHHATLHAGPTGALRFVDERSRNGTLVNGARVSEAVLADGDLLTIGDSFLVVREQVDEVGDADLAALVGHGPAMRGLRAAIARLAPTTATVLVLAETGCGKELVAQALHQRSRRAGAFVAVNCAAIPESLAESQLFGQLAGTFTGSVARPGLFRAADGGTLFLDELGELPAAIQPKLLRVLQDRMVLPVGATAAVACDVRVVAATNRDLRAEVEAGHFRGDLYARLAEYPLTIPPLRARREDLLALLVHALGEPRRLAPALVEALLAHRFPFNVRELQTLAARMKLHADAGAVLDLELVRDQLAPPPSAAPAAASPPGGPDRLERDASDEGVDAKDDREPPPGKAELEALMRAHRGVVANVARAMRRSRKQVYRWLELHGLHVDRFR
jgi:transcriptional regulator with PAS, ATPase and Fis domain